MIRTEPTHLTTRQLEDQWERLLRMRGELLASIRDKQAGTGAEADDRLLREVRDPGDAASQERRRELESLLGHRDRDRLREIHAALDRIGEGTYGICEATGEPIPLPRLRALPTTTTTVEAAEEAEVGQATVRQRAVAAEDERYQRHSAVERREGHLTRERE